MLRRRVVITVKLSIWVALAAIGILCIAETKSRQARTHAVAGPEEPDEIPGQSRSEQALVRETARWRSPADLTLTPVLTSVGGRADVQQPIRAEEELGRQLRSHRARLTPDGVLRGQLSVIHPATGRAIPISAVSVNLVRRGKISKRVLPRVTGFFEVADVTPAVYSLVAAGPDGFMAFPVHILSADEEGEAAAQPPGRLWQVLLRETSRALAIDGTAVPPSDFAALKQLIRSYVSNGSSTTSWIDLRSRRDYDGVPPGSVSGQGETERPSVQSTTRRHSVRLRPDGRLVGRVRRIHPQSGRPIRIHRVGIFVLRDDRVVTQTLVNELGQFSLLGLRPDDYSLVALGEDGFAAFSFHVLRSGDDQEAGANPRGSVTFVSVRHTQLEAQGSEFILDLIDPADLPATLEIVDQDLPGRLGLDRREPREEQHTRRRPPFGPTLRVAMRNTDEGREGDGGRSAGEGDGGAVVILRVAAILSEAAALAGQPPILASPFRL